MKSKSRIRWLDTTLVQGVDMALFIDPDDFAAAINELNVEDPPEFLPAQDALAGVHEVQANKTTHCFVVIGDVTRFKRTEIFTLLVHEAVHVWQITREFLGEDKPSSEFEAYAIQNISHRLIDEFDRQRKAKAHARRNTANPPPGCTA